MSGASASITCWRLLSSISHHADGNCISHKLCAQGNILLDSVLNSICILSLPFPQVVQRNTYAL